jgi:hypothetical protein
MTRNTPIHVAGQTEVLQGVSVVENGKTITNFGANFHLKPAAYYEPENESQVLEILDRHRGAQIRGVGSLHSWSAVIVTDGVIVNLQHLCEVEIERDQESCWAIVGAGCQIKTILTQLTKQGLTLPSLGLITEQTIAGAISTGTHGSGRHSLSHYIDAVRVARYDQVTGKSLIEVIDQGDALQAARCSLGCLGIILSVRIRCRPVYNIEEHFREYTSLDSVLESEKDFPLQQFFLIPWCWTYLAQHRRESTSLRSRLAGLYRIYWFLVFDLGLHLLLLTAARFFQSHQYVQFLYRNIIPRALIRNWVVTDESSAMLIMEHELFRHIEIELFVQKPQLPDALDYLRCVLEIGGNSPAYVRTASQDIGSSGDDASRMELLRGEYCHHYPICVRRVMSDETLISMASGDGSDWYAISLISYVRPADREGFFCMAEFLAGTMASRFGARPHWGKWCPLTSEKLIALYPRFDDFRTECESRDLRGVFRNPWISRLFADPSKSAPLSEFIRPA